MVKPFYMVAMWLYGIVSDYVVIFDEVSDEQWNTTAVETAVQLKS